MTVLPRMTEISGSEALWLLGGASRGQLVFGQRSLTVVRPAGHALEHGDLVVRVPVPSNALTDDTEPGVLATYHVHELDAAGNGWQVTATGPAEVCTDPYQLGHYRRTLSGWRLGPHDTIARIRPQSISGYRITTDRTSPVR